MEKHGGKCNTKLQSEEKQGGKEKATQAYTYVRRGAFDEANAVSRLNATWYTTSNIAGLNRGLSVIVLSMVLLVFFTGTAMAESWAQKHPRRTQVNSRLANQNRRINQEVRHGEITRGQAHQLHKEDRQMRREERNMARNQGGHITRAQQKALNQQENGVSRRIGH
jgi:hypothetical protein